MSHHVNGTVDPSPDAVLPHDTFNLSGKTTVILIHGALGSRNDWDLVAPALAQTYHLLIPDLPGHGQSRNITPFSIPYAARLCADLIAHKAHHGTAHVIGLSLGAEIGIALASRHPEVVQDVFVSGYQVFPPTALSPYMPYLFWLMPRLESLVPRPVVRWAMDGTDIQRVDTDTATLDLCRQITSPMQEEKWPAPWPARTLVVAAGKGGLIPSNDHPHDAIRLRQIGNELNLETVAMTHPRMRHPWCRQAPLLFAETARAWFEREELYAEFEPL